MENGNSLEVFSFVKFCKKKNKDTSRDYDFINRNHDIDIDFFEKNPRATYLDPEETLFIDAGANIGWFTLLAASGGVDALALEISTENALQLSRSANLHNDFSNGKNNRNGS